MVSLRCLSSMMLLIGATLDFKFLILEENKSLIRTSILSSSSLGLLQPTQYFNRATQVFIIIILPHYTDQLGKIFGHHRTGNSAF